MSFRPLIESDEKIGNEKGAREDRCREAVSAVMRQRNDVDDPLIQGLFAAATQIRDRGRALTIAQRMTQIGPENPLAYLALGLVCSRRGDMMEAHKAFERACHFANTWPSYASCKVHYYLMKGEIQKGRDLLKDLMREFPDRWLTLRARSHWLMVTGRTDKAREVISQTLTRKDDDPITLVLSAWCRLISGQRDQTDALIARSSALLSTVRFSQQEPLIAAFVVLDVVSQRWRFLRPAFSFLRKVFVLPPERFFTRLFSLGFLTAVGCAVCGRVWDWSVLPIIVSTATVLWLYLAVLPFLALAILRRKGSADKKWQSEWS